MTNASRHRVLWVGCDFHAPTYRLIYLQVIKHDDYTALAAKNMSTNKLSGPERHHPDCHREPLADNLPVRLAMPMVSHIRDPIALAQAIAGELEMDPG